MAEKETGHAISSPPPRWIRTAVLLTLLWLLVGGSAAAQTFTVSWATFYSPIELLTMGDPLQPGDLTACYVKGSTVTCGANIHNETGSYFISHTFSVSASYTDADGTYSLTPASASFPLTFAPHQTQGQSLSFSGMPSHVGKGTITVHINDGTDYPLSNTIYQVFSGPQSPMGAPWIEVLDIAIPWTHGDSTLSACLHHVTTGLYDSGLFIYPEDTRTYCTDPMDISIFDLTNFLGKSKPTEGNCVDVSDFLCICANALGLDLLCCAYHDIGDVTFTTTPLQPIGWSGYSPIEWHYHQICLDHAGDGDVEDACNAYEYYLDGSEWDLPAYSWTFPDWWQVEGPYGLVADPVPSYADIYDPIGLYAPGIE